MKFSLLLELIYYYYF